MAAHTGPPDLTTCTKETEPAAVAYTPVRWPTPWKRPIGSSVRSAAAVSVGGARAFVAHQNSAITLPTTSCAVAIKFGSASAMCACLFFTE